MKENNNKLECEKPTYLQQVKLVWEQKGMLGKFYSWLSKKMKGGQNDTN